MLPLYLKKNDTVKFLFSKKTSVRIKHENTVESGSMNKSCIMFRKRM